MLSPYRVLDLSDEGGLFTGTLLAQMGAEVVLVEPPGGSPGRHQPPFVDDESGLERSLHHLGFNRGKRSVVVDWATTDGAADLEALFAGADAVLMSGGPASHRQRGLPHPADLSERHPHLVVANVSGFGLSGPKADWADSDLVCGAAGFQQSVTGDYDRPPLRTAVPQVYMSAAADACVGVLIALAERERSGRGQVVDLSAQESWIRAGLYLPYSTPWNSPPAHRSGASPKIGPVTVRFEFPAADGGVTITLMLGAAVGPFTNRLVEWMVEDDLCPSDLAETDWATLDPMSDPTRLDRLNEAVGVFTATKTRAELMVAARERRLLLAPVFKIEDVLSADQYQGREVWRDVDLPDGRQVATPGPFAKFSPEPLPEMSPAPELGADTGRLAERPPRPVPQVRSDSVLPLEGLKVLDLTTSFAGPLIGRCLAAFGAKVVKVESAMRPDLARTSGPFLGDGFETSAPYAHANAGKLSIAVDLSRDESQDVLYDLAAWADVLIDAYAPGALARMSLDQQTLAELNPSLIVLQTTMLGQTGPLADVPGFGNMATALTGFFTTTGWPDSVPVGPVAAYTDMISPRFGAAAILAAVEHRRRTGKGAWIDLGQGEACLHFLTLGLLDTQTNGRSWESQGNADHFMAPHGVYPASGDDRWIAIACASDDQWRALAEIIGRPQLAELAESERRDRGVEIDELITTWTSGLAADEAQDRLQVVGVAAHQVQNSPECTADPQLAARGWLTTVSHPIMGSLPVGSPPIRMSRSAHRMEVGGPTLGQHTFDVLTDLLGYDVDRIAELAAAEILE